MVYNTREYTKHFIDTNKFRMLEENNTFIFRYASLFLARSNKKKEISYWNEEANSTNRQSWKVDSNTSFHGTRVAWLKSMDKKKKKSRVLSWIHSIIVTAAPAMPHRVRLVRHRISIYAGAKRIPQVYVRLFRRNDWFRDSALEKFSTKANFPFSVQKKKIRV